MRLLFFVSLIVSREKLTPYVRVGFTVKVMPKFTVFLFGRSFEAGSTYRLGIPIFFHFAEVVPSLFPLAVFKSFASLKKFRHYRLAVISLCNIYSDVTHAKRSE